LEDIAKEEQTKLDCKNTESFENGKYQAWKDVQGGINIYATEDNFGG
jgi:hypothetical protein